jgi:Fe-S cluster biogenesis protein NfuA
MAEDPAFQNRVRKIEALIQTIEDSADPILRDNARELVHTILELHGVGLIKILDFVNLAGHQQLVDTLARDDLIGSLLLLHGIHPLNQASRIEQALAKVQPRLFVHGGRVELLEVDNNVVRLRFQVRAGGSPADAAPLQIRQWIEEAICAAAPEVTAIQFDEVDPTPGSISLPIVAGEFLRGQP